MRRQLAHCLLAFTLTSALAWSQAQPESTPPSASEIAEAIETHREYFAAQSSTDEVEAQLDRAMLVLERGGANTLPAIVTAVDASIREHRTEDAFRVWACGYLWIADPTKCFADVLRIWPSIESFESEFALAFEVALGIAQNHPDQAIPVMRPLLINRTGEVLLHEYSPFGYPRTHVMLWSQLGMEGCDALRKILGDDEDDGVRSTVIRLLGYTTDLAALPSIRAIAHSGSGDSRRHAITALGLYGHPDDFDFLVGLLEEQDVEIVKAAVIALFDYEDMRAVPKLLPLLDAQHAPLLGELFATLGHLATVEVLAKFAPMLRAAPAGLPEAFQSHIMPGFRAIGVTWKSYVAMKPEQQAETITMARAALQERFIRGPGERAMTRDEFASTMAQWTKTRSLSSPGTEWVTEKQIVEVCTIDDVPALIELRGACLATGDDTGFTNADRIDQMLRRIVRATYRTEVGVCARVESPEH